MIDQLLKYKEAAKILSVSVRTVRRLVDEGTLSPIRVRGRVNFKKKDIQEYIEKHKTPR